MLHRVEALIRRDALRHNLAVARSHARGARVLAVVKANAYGHGLLPVAEALSDADMFGVTDVHEATLLREAGCDKDILLLQGLISEADVSAVAEGGFHVVVHRHEDLEWLERVLDRHPPRQPLTFWLKLQSGMGRLGLQGQDYLRCFHLLRAKPWTREVVLISHLANASLPDSPLNATQLGRFREAEAGLADLAPATSILASGGLLLDWDIRGSWVRPGIMLYGSSPYAWQDLTRRREVFGLRAVMELRARLISVGDYQAGDNIGYNSQFICPRPMRIGVVSIGYADGYPSHTPNGCPVEVGGERSQTVGRVSMDMLAVDLSHLPQVRRGDTVTLWGDNLSIDEIAAYTGVISYNLTCNVSARVPRVYV